MKPIAKLEDWFWWNGKLVGKVYGHPTIKDGQEVITSKVLPPGQELPATYRETKNTIYILGKQSFTQGA